MRHLAFFRELERFAPGSPNWHATAAALGTLRVVDRWADRAPLSEIQGATAAIRTDLTQAPQLERPMVALASLLAAIEDDTVVSRDISDVLARLLVCAERFADRGDWRLAEDVCSTLFATAGGTIP